MQQPNGFQQPLDALQLFTADLQKQLEPSELSKKGDLDATVAAKFFLTFFYYFLTGGSEVGRVVVRREAQLLRPRNGGGKSDRGSFFSKTEENDKYPVASAQTLCRHNCLRTEGKTTSSGRTSACKAFLHPSVICMLYRTCLMVPFFQRGQLNKIILKRWMALPEDEKEKFREGTNSKPSTPTAGRKASQKKESHSPKKENGSPKKENSSPTKENRSQKKDNSSQRKEPHSPKKDVSVGKKDDIVTTKRIRIPKKIMDS